MIKKLALVVIATFTTLSSTAFGLGLGDIDVRSNLNDPLEAEINLIQLQGLTSGEILPTLASNDDFRRAGVERSFFLSNINFRVVETESGEFVIRLTTRQAVREPFLNFLVEVNWPGGRLLKEYTVLLDPPVFDTGLAVEALVVEDSSASDSTVFATDLTTTTVVNPTEETETVTVAEPVAPRDDSLAEGEYRVQRNDTLWEIALKVPGREGYSPQQVMLAIQDLNPKAFLNNNINRVKAGSVLTLPDGRQMSTRSFEEAIAEVQAQNAGAAPNLRSPVGETTEVQLSATETTSTALPGGDDEKNPDGYLELTSESESSTTSASGEASATVDQLQNQLAIAEELNDQFERERDELESRVQELQDQIAIMERLLDVQNSDLAEVQQALTDTGTEEAVEEESAEPVTAESTEATTETAPSETVEPAVETPAVEPEVQQPVVATPVQPPVQAPVPAPEPGIMGFVNELTRSASNWVMASTTNMAITGAGLLLLILIPFYLRSKRNSGDQTLSELTTEEPESYEEIEEISTDFDDDLLAEVEDDFEEELAPEEPETLDAVVEAEMYMAYQKYDQAEEKLKEAFAEHPDRTDVGLKLLEVYAETGDANAFNDLENRLSLSSEQQSQASDLRAKLPVGALADSADLDLDVGGMDDDLGLDLSLDSDPSSEAPADDLGGDLDFDLDLTAEPEAEESLDSDLDFSLDEEVDLEPEADEALDLDLGSALDAEESSSDESDLDFSLDLGDLDETTAEDETSGDLDFSLDESLDLDLSEESEVDTEATEETSGDLDFSLDLEDDASGSDDISLDTDDLDLDLSVEEETPEAPAESFDLGEEDLSLDLEDESVELSVDEPEISLDLDADLSLEDDPTVELSTEAFESDGLDLSHEEDEVDLSFDEPQPEVDNTVESASDDPLEQLANSLDSDAELEEDEFDFLSGNDEASTKLDLARAYIEMDDKEGARDILEEVASEGNDDQKAQAEELMSQL